MVADFDSGGLMPIIEDKLNLRTTNKLINGNFDVWQRGTSFNFVSSGGYTADRWFLTSGVGGTCSCARTDFSPGQTDVPNNPRYYVSLNQPVASSDYHVFGQRIEDVRIFENIPVTLSFYAKSVMARPPFFSIELKQNFGSGGSPDVITPMGSINVNRKWQKYVLHAFIPTVSGKTIGTGSFLELDFLFPPVVTFHLALAQIQLEKGYKANDFEIRHYADELALCQRYYEKGIIYAAAYSTSFIGASVRFAVDKRVVPTITYSVIEENNVDSKQFLTITEQGFNLKINKLINSNVYSELNWTAEAEL